MSWRVTKYSRVEQPKVLWQTRFKCLAVAYAVLYNVFVGCDSWETIDIWNSG